MLISISDIITESWKLYRSHFKQLVPYMGLLLLPTLLLTLISGTGIFLETYLPSSAALNGIAYFIILAVTVFSFAWVYVALFKAVGDIIQTNITPHWKTSLQSVLPYLWPLLYTVLLSYLIILLGTLLLIIPGIIFAVWYSFVTYEVLFNAKRGKAALDSSKSLVKGRWWSIALRLLIPSFVIGIAIMLAGLFVSLPTLLIPDALWSEVVRSIISVLGNALFAPLTILPPIILYFSARANPVADSTDSSTAPEATV